MIYLFIPSPKKTWESLAKGFASVERAQVIHKLNKYNFYQKKIHYLGYIISEKGMSMDPKKIKAIMNWPTPRNVANVRSFMGLTDYYYKIQIHKRIFQNCLLRHFFAKERENVWMPKEMRGSFPLLKKTPHWCTNSENCWPGWRLHHLHQCMHWRDW